MVEPICRECGRGMPLEVARKTGVVCLACGRAEPRMRRRRRDARYCSEACKHHAYRQRRAARVVQRTRTIERAAALIGYGARPGGPRAASWNEPLSEGRRAKKPPASHKNSENFSELEIGDRKCQRADRSLPLEQVLLA
jgi:hypothetical protein